MSEQSSHLDFEGLKPYLARRFVPAQARLEEASEIVGLYQILADRKVSSRADLEQWILDRSELEAAVDQQGSLLYIRMTCHTDHKEYVERYQRFLKDVSPAVKPWEHRLNQRYLELVQAFPAADDRYAVYDREIATDMQLFREENIPLETEVDLLSQEYQSLCGKLTVTFQGKERTMPQMGKYLEDPSRELRESAWRAMSRRRLAEKDRFEEIFSKMLTRRNTIARQAGFQNFRDYQFAAYHRFDYTPEDCRAYHRAIEEIVVPLNRSLLERRKEQMQIETLRPWDTQVDPLGRPPLKPFKKVSQLVDGVQNIFAALDGRWDRAFRQMQKDGLLDLESRRGKAPGGYQSSLDESRKPFIFMNAVGMDHDVMTLLHECGHAFHSLACAAEPLQDYRHGPMEFNEVASMSMELLAGEFLTEFYTPEEQQRSWQNHLESVLSILVWVATVDAFQHWLYEHPGHAVNERTAAWLEVNDRFGTGLVDWTGLEEEQATSWHRQLHIFEVPFYYIEYGIAQLGALQIWLNAQQNKEEAITRFQQAMALGGSRPLPELFETAGLKFDFSAQTIRPLMERVRQDLALSTATRD